MHLGRYFGACFSDRRFDRYDPEHDDEQRIKDCAIMRLYTHSFDPKTGDKFSHLLGCSAIDLVKLMEHSYNVTASEGLYCFNASPSSSSSSSSSSVINIIPASELREYDIPLRTNFCNTFALCTVAPFGGKMHTWGSGEYDSSTGPEIHAGLRVVVDSTPEEFRKAMQPQLQAIKAEIDKLKNGIAVATASLASPAATAQAASGINTRFAFGQSVLRHLGDIQMVVKLQQGLQQVCVCVVLIG